MGKSQSQKRAREMALWLIALTALAEELNFVPCIHITTTCNFSYRYSVPSFGFCGCAYMRYIHRCTHIHISKNKKWKDLQRGFKVSLRYIETVSKHPPNTLRHACTSEYMETITRNSQESFWKKIVLVTVLLLWWNTMNKVTYRRSI